jgi:hypothetical protein
MMGLGEAGPMVDFLHSRLAAPKVSPIPKWAIPTALAAIALIAAIVYANGNLSAKQAEDDQYASKLTDPTDVKRLAEAKAFVGMVSTAQAWHGGKPQYLACFLDLSMAIPYDQITFITNLSLKEANPPGSASALSAANNRARLLSGSIQGKTSNDAEISRIRDGLNGIAAFTGAKITNKVYVVREKLISFTIEFTYDPSLANHKPG